MNHLRLITRSLRHYWRLHVCLAAATAIATAVLAGAMSIGDSVQHSLARQIERRLGGAEVAMYRPGRFFRQALAPQMQQRLQTPASACLMLDATAQKQDGPVAGHVKLVGVDSQFAGMSPQRPLWPTPGAGEVVLNEQLARQLGARLGDRVYFELAPAGSVAPEMDLAERAQVSGFWANVIAIAGPQELGDFELVSSPQPACNAFVDIAALAKARKLDGMANLLLIGGHLADEESSANAAMKECWQLEDAQLQAIQMSSGRTLIRSGRYFIDSSAEAAMLADGAARQGALMYFASELRAGDKAVPYSFVCAATPDKTAGGRLNLLLAGLNDDEIVINRWLADDLQASAGQMIAMRYFVLGTGGLREEAKSFKVRDVIELGEQEPHGALLPDVPGLTDVTDCRDWKSQLPIDLTRIRPRDQQYWREHRGLPKAYVTLKAGKEMWAGRFGALTGVVFEGAAASIARDLPRRVDPAAAGLVLDPIRKRSMEASRKSGDFGQLFAGFSFFLLASAMLLVWLGAALSASGRARQVGTLLAMGYAPRHVRRLVLAEMLVPLAAGAAAGVLLAVAYAAGLLAAMRTIWSGAFASTQLDLAPKASTLLACGGAALLLTVAAVYANLRRQFNMPVRQLIAGQGEAPSKARHGRKSLWAGLILLAAAGAVAAVLDHRQAEAFFASGSLALVGALCLAGYFLRRGAPSHGRITLVRLAIGGACRRRGRTLATVALLACATFLLVSIAANRPQEDFAGRSGSTGGFSLVAQSTLPLDAKRLDAALGAASSQTVRAYVQQGDDASCLSMQRPALPRLLGIRPAELQGRFNFSRSLCDYPQWLMLRGSNDGTVVDAIGDENTVTWSLGKKVGDKIEYRDEQGRRVTLQIAAILHNCVLQGSLVISDDAFRRLFPSTPGPRMLLIDAPGDQAHKLGQALERTFQAQGMTVWPADVQMRKLSAVEDTYLQIFGLLGALGLLLGTVGLGALVVRNVIQRRSELAALWAIGFTRGRIVAMILLEHAAVLIAAVAVGTCCAMLALAPSLTRADIWPALRQVLTWLGIVTASGLLASAAGAWWSMRGSQLDALRAE